ncbi:MAG: TRAP transporter small permease [Anaerolineae bacterium]
MPPFLSPLVTAQKAARPPGWFDRLIDVLALIAGMMLCVLTVLICMDVAARYFRLFAMPWTLDVAEYLLYLITFFGSPWVLREGGHIAIDLFVQQLRPPARRRAAFLSHVVGAVVCAVLLYYSCRVWWASFEDKTLIHETFVFPEWVLFSAAPPTFLILLVIFVRWIARRTETLETERPRDGI